jgi:hypothetical protein
MKRRAPLNLTMVWVAMVHFENCFYNPPEVCLSLGVKAAWSGLRNSYVKNPGFPGNFQRGSIVQDASI